MSSNYRYAYITSVDISIDNGPGINDRELVKELIASYGDRVTCIVPYPSQPNNYFDSKIKYTFNHRGYHPLFYLLHKMSTIYKIINLHRKNTFDALIFRLDVLPIEPLILSKLLKIPLILEKLAGYMLFTRLIRKKENLISQFSLSLYRIASNKSIMATTVSESYMEWIKFKYHLNSGVIHIIPNGTNLKMFSPSDKNTLRNRFNLNRFKYVVGYVGALSILRNIDVLIRAFSKVKQKENIALVLVGEGKDRSKIEALLKEKALLHNVILTGFVPYADVPNYMNSFDVAVDLTYVPMKIGNAILNASYSQKIPQYLACGLPVIAWDVEDNKFLAREKIGYLVNIGDEEGLAHAIEYFACMSELEKKEMSKRARLYAEKTFSMEILAKKRILLWDNAMDVFYQTRRDIRTGRSG